MLVSAKEMLQKAKAGHYAVGQFNINNLEWTKAILLTAQENNSPVILGVSEGAGKYMGGYDAVVGMVPFLGEAEKLTKWASGKVKGKIKDKEAKAVEDALKSYGIDAKTAKKLGNAVKEADKERDKQKAKKDERMQKYKQDFQNILFK